MDAFRPSRALPLSVLACLAGLSLLASACGGSPASHVAQLGSTEAATQSSTSSTTSASSAQDAALAFSRCMRAHGVPTFPDPDSEGRFPVQSSMSDAAKRPALLSAQQACKHLLPNAGGGAGTRGAQLKLAFALKTARCMRSHGFPTYPDPATSSTSSQGSGDRFDGAGIDIRSQRFQTAEAACERQARTAVGLP